MTSFVAAVNVRSSSRKRKVRGADVRDFNLVCGG
jgi:hypothetical protein